VIRRIAGILTRPRATLTALGQRPVWAGTWVFILGTWAACGGWLLSTDIGRQALVDEQVRVVESVGGIVTDEAYAAMLARPPWWVYFTSGGRLLLTPPATLLVAAALWLVGRMEGAAATWRHALAVAVHASIVLLLAQLIATPLHYVRESLTSPINMAAILPLMEEGTVPARFFGSIDLFAVWWATLLAIGLSVLTRQRVTRYAMPLAAIFAAFAAVVAAVTAVLGGS
jgi:hypothetical protein